MKYHLLYSSVENMGDQLNKYMLEELFGIKVLHANMCRSNMIAIGSGLEHIYLKTGFENFRQKIFRDLFYDEPFYVWGTGLMNNNPEIDRPLRFKDVHFLALRGNLTKKRIEKVINRELDIPLADGGLLAERWVERAKEKKYAIGIIPHFREQDSPLIKHIANKYAHSIVIDLRSGCKNVVKQISECDMILSSSLHGLIVADSYHIPNRHIMLYDFGERMLGDGYKFSDYYSSYGLEDERIKISSVQDLPDFNSIIDGYKVSKDIVELKKKQLYSVFPR